MKKKFRLFPVLFILFLWIISAYSTSAGNNKVIMATDRIKLLGTDNGVGNSNSGNNTITGTGTDNNSSANSSPKNSATEASNQTTNPTGSNTNTNSQDTSSATGDPATGDPQITNTNTKSDPSSEPSSTTVNLGNTGSSGSSGSSDSSTPAGPSSTTSGTNKSTQSSTVTTNGTSITTSKGSSNSKNKSAQNSTSTDEDTKQNVQKTDSNSVGTQVNSTITNTVTETPQNSETLVVKSSIEKGDINLSDKSVLVKLSCDDMNFKELYYCWSSNKEVKHEEVWLKYSEPLKFEQTGILYLHYKAIDKNGNDTYGYFGPYNAAHIYNTLYTNDSGNLLTKKIIGYVAIFLVILGAAVYLIKTNKVSLRKRTD